MPVICVENFLKNSETSVRFVNECRHIEEKFSRYPFTISPPLG